MSKINYDFWLLSEEQPQAPATAPGFPPDPMGSGMTPPQGTPDPNAAAPPKDPDFTVDVSQDPQSPHMPGDGGGEESPHHGVHFEEWRNRFFKESIKGNSNALIDMINQVRDRDLHSSQRKFVEDNLQVQFLRQQSNVMQASREVRKKINERLDRNNPATTLVHHIDDALQQQRALADNLIKMSGYYGMKGDLHRKYVAAILGAVQVGSGANNEDVILNDKEYSVSLSTRMARDFGRFDVGTWSLRANEPERFLSEPETRRLESGSPEEKEALRHRVVIESICNRFSKRGYILTVVGDDGTVYNVGWDIATCLKSSYTSGRLVLKTKTSENSEITITKDGAVVPYQDIDVKYVKETGEDDEDGHRVKHLLDFIERRDGILFLVAPLDLLKEASGTLQGLVVTEVPYQGNPSDLTVLNRCVYSATEMVMRQC